jgi:predicted phage terminase large subunit-like protein
MAKSQNDIDRIIQSGLAFHSAWEFCLYMDEEFYTKREFLQVVADTFQYLIQGDETPSDIIERIKSSKYVKKFNYNPREAYAAMSPRAGKSYCLTLCCSWGLGKYPIEAILRSSSSQKLYRKFSRGARYFIGTDEFKQVFPNVELSKDNADVDGWSLNGSKQGSYFGSGVDGSIIGMGASLIALTDDLYKSHNDALSPAINERTNEFMESAFDSRLEKNCPQFDVGTRWTTKDYMGNKIKEEQYDIIIIIPALDENDKSFCEDVKTTEEYLEKRDHLKKGNKEHIWEAEYMQLPIEVKGLLFPSSQLRRFKMADLNMDNLIAKIGAIDTADEGADSYSFGMAYIFPKDKGIDVYIPKVIYTKDPLRITEPRTIQMIEDEEPEQVNVEVNKEGTLYVKNLKEKCKSLCKVLGFYSKGNKDARIFAQSDFILDFYFLDESEQNDEYQAFFENLTSYLKEGKNEHDDAPDNMAQLAKAIRKKFKSLLK